MTTKKAKSEETAVQELTTTFESNSLVRIDFKGLLNEHISEEYCNFSLEKKRVYKNLHERIVDDLNYFIPRVNSLKFSLVEIKYKIVNLLKFYSEEEFTKDVLNIFAYDDVVQEIEKYVEENYAADLNSRSKNTKNVNTELQFKDVHAKIIIKASVAQRLIIPLLTDYIMYHYSKDETKGNHKKDEKLTMDIFSKIILIFSPEEEKVDIFNKLFRFVASRVLATRGSDKVIWSYLRNMSKDINNTIRAFYRSTIITVIPKLLVDSNIISFFHVVLNRSIKFLFTYNYTVNFRPVNRCNVDNEGLTEFDRMEISMVRFNEGQAMINKVAIKWEINNLMRMYNIEITPDEFQYYKENMQINQLQTNILFLMFAKNFQNYFSPYSCDYDQYITLAIIARKILEQRNFKFLAKFITSIPEKEVQRKKLSKNRDFLNRLTSSKKYEDLLYKKYDNIIPNIVNSGILIQLIMTLKNHPFYHIPDFFSEEDELEQIDEPIEVIADELLDFSLLI